MPIKAMVNFVRNSSRAMPPYKEAILSDADMKEIHAYLVAIPKPADPNRSRCSRSQRTRSTQTARLNAGPFCFLC